MTRLSKSVLAILLVGPFCFCPISNGQGRKSGVDSAWSGFPGYHLLTLKERDSDTQAFLLEYFPTANPSVVHADFAGDGHLDYALLLRNDKSQATKVVVLSD